MLPVAKVEFNKSVVDVNETFIISVTVVEHRFLHRFLHGFLQMFTHGKLKNGDLYD